MKNKICRAMTLGALMGLSHGAANAQSTVTLTGVVDATVRSTSNSSGRVSSVVSGQNSTSRLVIRGIEDLGDGLKASFWLEGSLATDTGVAGTGSQFWDRQATVALSGPFGELRLGRDWTPVYYGFVFADPWINVGVGSASNFLNASVATTYQRAFGSALNPTTLSRSSNAVEYWLPPSLGGVYGNVMVAPGEGNNTGGAFRYTAGRLGYRAGAFDASVYAGATRIDATGADLKQTGIYGSYNLAPVMLMASLTQSRYLESKHQHLLLGTRVVLSASWVLKASYNRLDQSGRNAAGASINADDSNQFAVGVEYFLSKRTALYGTAAHLSNKGVARFAIPGGPLAVAPGSSSTGYDLGLRHSF